MLIDLRHALHRFYETQGFLLGAALSFSFLLCLAPLALLFFSGAGFLLASDQAAGSVVKVATSLLPGYSAEILRVLDLLNAERRVTGTLGLVGLAVFATPLFALTRTAMNAAFRVERARGLVHGFAFDLGALAGVGLLAIALASALLLLATLSDIAARAGIPTSILASVWVRAMAPALLYVTLLGLLFFVYRTFPNTAVSTRAAITTTLIVAVLWEIARLAFAAYLTSFGTYNKLYGSFGVIAATLAWIYYSAAIFVFGAGLTAVLSERYRGGAPDPLAAVSAGAAEPPAPPSRLPAWAMTARRSSWLRRLVLGAATVVALLVAAVAAVPLVVDGDRVRHAVERRISDVAGGEVRYDSLRLRFFPRPRAEIRNATVRIPGAVTGRVSTLEIRIALLPLLAGHVRPVAVNVGQPVLELTIQPGSGGGDPLDAYRTALSPVVDALVRHARGMSLGIVDGKLDVLYVGQRILSLSGLALDARVAADAIHADASGSADLWRTASLWLKIVPGSLAATSKLQLSGLRLAEVLQAAGLQSEVRVLAAAIDATLDADTDGHESVRAGLTATAPGMTLARGARTLELGAMRSALDARRDGTAVTVSLRALQLGEYLPAATGALRAKPDGTAPAVELEVPALDLVRLRAAALALAGDLDAVRTAAALVTAAAVQSLRIGASGSDFASLPALGSVRAEARLASAALDVPALGIAIANGAGRLVLADGTLRGSELSGAIGRSSVKDGTLAVALAPAVALRALEAAVDADLAETLALARRAIGKPEPAALADVESLHGRATGTVAYEARRSGPRFVVEVAALGATGRYRNVPLPIAITRGQVRYAPDHLVVRGLHGSVGRSSIQAGALHLALGPEPAVRAASAAAVVILDEIYPWLTSLEGLRRPASEISSATGTVAMELVRLSGPVNAPAALEYEAVIRPQPVRLAGPVLPAPVTLAGGELRITPRSIALDRLDASMLDARVVATGTVQEHASAAPRLDLALADGTAGERTLDWARSRWQLPGTAMPRAPLTLTSGQVQGTGGAGAPFAAQGSVGLAGGVRAEFDLASHPGHLDLRRLAVKDPDTDAQATLKWAASTAELAFRGTLDHATLARVLAEPPARQGALRGEFHATIDLAEPWESRATGALEGERIDILERWGVPVAIERLRIDVAGDTVQIHEGAIALVGERLALTGSVTRQPKTFGLDLRVTADAIDVERLLRAFPPDGTKPPAAGWDLPVDGRIAVDAKSVTYGTHVVRPVSGTVALTPNRIVADVKEARLCGIAVPLSAVLVPGNVNVTGRIEARAQPLARAMTCLLGQHYAMTGTLDLDADLSANGPAEALARTARGTFQLTARNGQIQKAPIMARILSLDAVAGLLRARPSELMASGLDYSELAVAGTLDAGRVRIANGTLTAAALGLAMAGVIDIPAGHLDMQGVVASFGRIQDAMQHVPVVGRVLGTRAVGIPLSVTGDLRDPRVMPLDPAAIGQSVVNLLGAVMKTPVDLLDLFVGRQQPAP